MDNQSGPGQLPGVSVVIPTYNRADRVCRAIESVLHQTYRAAELIVVDDGSRDATREQVLAFGDQVRYVYQDNAGAAVARNHGAREARFPWLAFLDSDDVWSPAYLEHIAAAITGTAGAAALYFTDAEFEESTPPKNRWARIDFRARAPFEILTNPRDVVLAEGQPMLLPFSVFQRSVFLASGGLWERLAAGEDTHLYIRLGLAHELCAVPVPGGIVKGGHGDADRLTTAFGSNTVKHWDCSIMLWSDILNRFHDLSHQHRRLVTGRLADAYWRKGVIAAKQHKLLTAAASWSRSFTRDPSIALRVALRKLHKK